MADPDRLAEFERLLEEAGGRLHRADSLHAARARARELIGDGTVARWREDMLDGIAAQEAPPAEANVSLIVADVGVQSTGAIGWAHGAGRPRATGLLPTRQIALLARRDLVEGVPEALHKLGLTSPSPPSNVVFAAGPSRTSDIEQRSIRGVHAPRELDVIVFS